MKKLICIFASAALLGACEQRTDVVAPASSPTEKKESNTTIVNPTTEKTKETSTSTNTNTTTTTTPPPSDSSSTSTSTTTTTSSPSP